MTNGFSILQDIERKESPERLTIWGLGGAGFAVRVGESVFYIDPYLAPPEPGRTQHRGGSIPFSPEEIRRASAVFSTHEHEDHCNCRTLLGFANYTDAPFVGPESSARKAVRCGYPEKRVVTLRPSETYQVKATIRVLAFQARDPYEEHALMYLVETPKGNLFHSGDTSYFEGFLRVGESHKVDVALLNFGKQIPTPEKPYYMNAQSVADAARDLRARVVVPMHWNLWVETREDPRPIEALLRATSPESRMQPVDYGEKFEL
jgi:L-ascorbate metabolism protein UlaG (beta-lactamase superfamily)